MALFLLAAVLAVMVKVQEVVLMLELGLTALLLFHGKGKENESTYITTTR
jgi:hypothetical protein